MNDYSDDNFLLADILILETPKGEELKRLLAKDPNGYAFRTVCVSGYEENPNGTHTIKSPCSFLNIAVVRREEAA